MKRKKEIPKKNERYTEEQHFEVCSS